MKNVRDFNSASYCFIVPRFHVACIDCSTRLPNAEA